MQGANSKTVRQTYLPDNLTTLLRNSRKREREERETKKTCVKSKVHDAELATTPQASLLVIRLKRVDETIVEAKYYLKHCI